VVRDRLTGKELRGLLFWIILGIAGALFAYKFYFAAFPEASVDFHVSRMEALGRARAFLATAGDDLSGYQSTIVFDTDDDAKTYLEREVGLAQANRLMSGVVSVWYWKVRFFRPQQEEEFSVRVSPGGRITGYEHKIEESRAGAAFDRAVALGKAEGFLRALYGADLSGWDFLPEEASSVQRPKRLDWTFAWEKHGFRAKDAPYRLHVTIEGDRVGGVQEYVKVPEAWQEGYKRLRSSNIFYNQVAIIPYALLMGAAVWLGFKLTRRGQVGWTGALKLGVFVAALLLVMQLNEWPITRSTYDTNSSYSSFVATSLLSAVLFALGSALMVLLVLPAGEALYRNSQPERMRLGKAFTPKGIRTKEFFCSSIVGIALAAAHIGFVVAFYLIGSRFGVWAPQDVNYTNSVSTAIPWISGAAIGILASTSEEFLFRLFAIPFLVQVTRSRVLAVILPAFAWGFLHSAYLQEPGYIRGVEVGIIGIVAGIVMLRWGIVATLIWHYTVDASLFSLLLLRSESIYLRVSGVVVGAAAFVPLAVSGVSYLARGGFETDETLENRSKPIPEATLRAATAEAASEVSARRYDSLSAGKIGLLIACVVLGGALLLRVKPERVGDYLRLSVNAREARVSADKILRQRGVRPETYHAVGTLVDVTDDTVNEFLRRRVGIARINQVYAGEVPGALWRVRYFRDGQKEEYAVILRPDGSLHSVRHTLAEEARGASLTKEQAQARAEVFLRDAKKIDLTAWKLVEANSEKRPARIDYTLTWEKVRPLDLPGSPAVTADPADHAYARMEVQVLGDEVTSYRTYVKIPEESRRKQEEETLPRTLYRVGQYLLSVALGLTALILYLVNLRSPAAADIPWKRIALWAPWGVAGFLAVFALGNRLPLFLAAYDTAMPLKYLFGGIAIGVLLGAGFYFATLMLLFGLAWFYGVKAFGEDRLPAWKGMPAAYYRDALAIAVGGTAALAGLTRLSHLWGSVWNTPHRSLEAAIGQGFSGYVPAAQVIGGSVLSGFMWTGIVVLAAAFIAARMRARWMRLGLFLLTALALVGDWGNGADFTRQLIARGILLGAVWWGTQRLVRFNLLGYFLVAALTSLMTGASDLLAQPNAFYRANGVAIVAAAAFLVAWPLWEWQRQRNPGPA
jgi:membrane protease YdiL (CAAX protease family)